MSGPPSKLSRVARALRRVLLALVVLLGALVAVNVRADRPAASLTARWAAPPSRFLDVDGLRVHLRDEGPRDDPRPIVLLHGTADSLHTWEGWARVLRANHRVVRMDMPGFGLTGPAVDGQYTIAAYVRFVRRVLTALAIERCVLVGNSLGGEVAWQTALDDPPRVERLILVDSAGYPFAATSQPIAFKLGRTPGLRMLVRWVTPRRMVASSVRNVYGDPSRVTDALVDRYYELALREGNRQALIDRFRQAPPGARASDIARLRVPTLILWGSRDRLIPPSRAAMFHQAIEGSELVQFDGLGHVPQEEDPARTVAAVERWLAAH